MDISHPCEEDYGNPHQDEETVPSQKRALSKNVLVQILSGLRYIFRLAEIAPIVFVGAKGDKCFSQGSKTQIRVDNGEGPMLRHRPKQTRRNHVNAGESQRLRVW